MKTTSQNLKFLKTEGILFSGVERTIISAIPATIRDAMYLVKAVGERYLWADCLCVIQDAPSEEMNRTLQAMAHIYASAEFTIAVACGNNANYGIRGIGGPSRKRSTQDFAHAPNWDAAYPSNSCWAQRGWTFQESLFSRRLLVFNVAVSWLCGKDVRHECYEDPAALHDHASFPDERPHSGAPMGLISLLLSALCLGRWGLLVQNYSTRLLTFEDDTVRAFAGATNVMNSRFPGGMLHGLPVFYFDIAMLWRPDTQVSRRPGQPSWSWTGWKGGIQCQDRWKPHFAGLYMDTGESQDWLAIAPLRPVATYTCTTAESAASLDMVRFNGFYSYQAFREDVYRLLPPGWTLHHHPEGHFYTKDDICGGESPYAYPLPAADSSHANLPVPTSPVLMCTAPIVTTTIGIIFNYSPESYMLRTRVYNDHARASLVLSGGVESFSGVVAGVECQLIAISEAQVEHPNRMARWYWAQCGRNTTEAWHVYNALSVHFYNVLWIEWKDGIAYRKALGMMSKQNFDALGPRVHSFKLG